MTSHLLQHGMCRKLLIEHDLRQTVLLTACETKFNTSLDVSQILRMLRRCNAS